MLMRDMAYRKFMAVFAFALALSLVPALADDANSSVAIKSDDGKVQIVVPPGWVKQQSTNPGAALEVRNEDSNAFVMVMVTDRSDPYLALEDYARQRRDEILSHLINARFTGPDDLKLNGFKALQYEVHGTQPKSQMDFGYFLTIAQMRHHYLEVIAWSPEKHFADNADTLKSTAKSATYSGEE
jgi:hypothetical protein